MDTSKQKMAKLKVALCVTKNRADDIEQIYKALLKGLSRSKDTIIYFDNKNTVNTSVKQIVKERFDVIIQVADYSKYAQRTSNFMVFREKLLDAAKQNKIPRIIFDTGYTTNIRSTNFNYKESYFASSFDGIKGAGKYFNTNSPSDRWEQLGIQLKPWKSEGDYILVLGQSENGISTQHLKTDVIDWLSEVINHINNEHPDIPVYFRPHHNENKMPTGNYQIFDRSTSLIENLQNAKLTVGRTTNAIVTSIIEGVPVYCIDPISMAYPMAEHDINNLFSPVKPDRQQWAYDLAYTQWSLDELADPDCWWNRYRKLVIDNYVLRSELE